jgi:proteasome lid subunit RPN8/RPN11
MDNNYWLHQARKYISEHRAFSCVSEIVQETEENIITAEVTINLPSKFIECGVTDKGVKNKEKIKFVFPKDFPLVSPKIVLRDDFSRNFPHINPSSDEVIPCIYEGKLAELLQEQEWMNGILDQLVNWLETAARNSLLNYEQGWEPMRNDNCVGFVVYDDNKVIAEFRSKPNFPIRTRDISYSDYNDYIIADYIDFTPEKKNAKIIFAITPYQSNIYIPNRIGSLNDFYVYAKSIGIENIKIYIEDIDKQTLADNKLFVTLMVKRPCNIIGTDSDIEFLNFVIYKNKQRKGKKRVLPECQVGMLYHITDKSPPLLQRLAGLKLPTMPDKKMISILGCGSLGSKIALHLARNGNNDFYCIDNDIFLPHNNARHALSLAFYREKAWQLANSIKNISYANVHSIDNNAHSVDYSNSRIIIDTTASFSVRNFLMENSALPQIISAGLYNSGLNGLLLIENHKKNCKLLHEWAFLYYQSLSDKEVRGTLFSNNLENIHIGQSCSSQTMVASDAQISLMAAVMSMRIQEVLSDLENTQEEILFYTYSDSCLKTSKIGLPKFHKIAFSNEWDIYISAEVSQKMLELLNLKSPNETGGVLLGTVFNYARSVVITSLLPPPPDSSEEKKQFILGTANLYQTIQQIEHKSHGKVTYLGTWHTHPSGGSASSIDKNTFEKLLKNRNYEPTVCLIQTPTEIILVDSNDQK